MRLLLDTCVWGVVNQDLVGVGYDVLWARDWYEDPGDEEILSRASRESRIFVTLDKYFGELAIVYSQRHVGILRFVNLSARQPRGMPSGSYKVWH